MSRAVWVFHLPDQAEIKVESGRQVEKGELLALAKGKEFKSPVKSQVSEIKSKKIKLKFPTIKVSGKGYGKESVWGRLGIYDQLELTDINCDLAGELIFVPKLSNLLLKKGAVIGIAGFISFQREEKVNNLEVPVLIINKDDKKKLTKHQGENCLLHASKDCLLIPKNEN
jgi:hypothetical protein